MNIQIFQFLKKTSVNKKKIQKTTQNLSNKKYLKESPPIPKLMHIELSNACNHACLFCSNPLMQRKK